MRGGVRRRRRSEDRGWGEGGEDRGSEEGRWIEEEEREEGEARG